MATAISFSSVAENYKFEAADSTLATQLCVQAGNNNKSGIKSVMRKMYGSSSSAYAINTIRCNNLSIAKFSFKYGAKNTFKYLNVRSFGENKVIPTTSITDVALLPNDENKALTTVYVLAKL